MADLGRIGHALWQGLATLSQCEAKTTEALARSQLAGIKLLLLAVLLRLVLTGYEGLLYGPGNRLTHALGRYTLGLPKLQSLLLLGAQAPWVQFWASIYGELFEQVLRLAVKGHLIIGMLRLYGFNAFRNTYKPLLAESIVEFWNRYFYYFKELLSTFFFMPTFTGFGDLAPGRLRGAHRRAPDAVRNHHPGRHRQPAPGRGGRRHRFRGAGRTRKPGCSGHQHHRHRNRSRLSRRKPA